MNTQKQPSKRRRPATDEGPPKWILERLEQLRGNASFENSVTSRLTKTAQEAQSMVPAQELFRELLVQRLRKMAYPYPRGPRPKFASVHDALERAGLHRKLLTQPALASLRVTLVVFKEQQLEREAKTWKTAPSKLLIQFHKKLLKSLLQHETVIQKLTALYPKAKTWIEPYHRALVEQIHIDANALYPLYPAYSMYQPFITEHLSIVRLYDDLFHILQDFFPNTVNKTLTYHVISVLCSLYEVKGKYSLILPQTIARELSRAKSLGSEISDFGSIN